MRHPSRYFADDKDIYDLLMSQKRKLNDETLRRFLRERGIIVSPNAERSELAQYMSRLPMGWRDLQTMLERVGSVTHRTGRTTSEAVGVSVEQIETAAHAVRDERTERRGEEYRIVKKSDGSLEININYSILDTTKSRLRQRSEQHATISVDPGASTGGVRIRYPEEERGREIADAIILRALGDPKGLVRETIALDGCNAAQRTRFFEILMNGIDGFSLRTVTQTRFRRLDDKTADSELDGDTDTLTLPGIEDEETDARILRVQLDGAGVFASSEFQQLKRSGFYVSSVVWRARMDAGDGLDAEFDAGFVVADSGSAFTYRLRGVFRRNEHGEHARTRESPTSSERGKLLRALEDAAVSAQDKVREGADLQGAPQPLGDPDDSEAMTNQPNEIQS